jgi:hypothetical protein
LTPGFFHTKEISMEKHSSGPLVTVLLAAAWAAVLLTPLRAEAEDTSKGTVVYKDKTMELKYVYLVKGPDYTSSVIRELVFSPTDIGAKIQACTDMSCVGGVLDEGMTVDFDSGPRLNYWIVMNGQMVQYSGTADPSVFTATADAPDRLAGSLKIDSMGGGVGTLEVEFDATLVKEF